MRSRTARPAAHQHHTQFVPPEHLGVRRELGREVLAQQRLPASATRTLTARETPTSCAGQSPPADRSTAVAAAPTCQARGVSTPAVAGRVANTSRRGGPLRPVPSGVDVDLLVRAVPVRRKLERPGVRLVSVLPSRRRRPGIERVHGRSAAAAQWNQILPGACRRRRVRGRCAWNWREYSTLAVHSGRGCEVRGLE